MDTFLAALPVFQTEMNAAGSVAGLSLQSNSTTSLTIGTGSKSLTVDTGKGYVPGQTITVAYTTTPSNYMFGTVTSYNTGTGALVVNVTAVAGSGTFALWSIGLALNIDTSTLATLAGAQTLVNKTMIASTLSAPVFEGVPVEDIYTITDGVAVDINPANGGIQLWTLGASRTPTAASFAAGQSVTLMINDGTAYAITWSTIAVTWLTSAGTAPTLKTSGYTPIVLWKTGTTVYGVA